MGRTRYEGCYQPNKSRFSLGLHSRFFGQGPKKWGGTQIPTQTQRRRDHETRCFDTHHTRPRLRPRPCRGGAGTGLQAGRGVHRLGLGHWRRRTARGPDALGQGRIPGPGRLPAQAHAALRRGLGQEPVRLRAGLRQRIHRFRRELLDALHKRLAEQQRLRQFRAERPARALPVHPRPGRARRDVHRDLPALRLLRALALQGRRRLVRLVRGQQRPGRTARG